MKISYNWLKELLPDLAQDAGQVAELLTLHSFETIVGGQMKIDPHITTAKIVRIEPHPQADRLRLATVNHGAGEVTVVCGAPNIQVGHVVPFSPPGTTLKDEEGHTFVLEETKIRGVMSPGMLNSPREIGLGEWHGGIWILPPDTKIGQKLSDLISADTIIETDITPNRAHDCLSYIGVAREVAALLNLGVKEPPLPKLSASTTGQWQVEITDPADTPRYMGASVENLTVAPAPLSIQVRLLLSGTRPINNLVDITNYVLYEQGNPVHLFDAKLLPGKTIGTRLARRGEKLTDLDEITHQFAGDELVVTSGDQPVALAGIMGGLETSIGENTTNGFLEVANFSAPLIQKTSQKLNIRTESSARFSKGIDPNKVVDAHARCLALLTEHAGAKVTQVLDAYPRPAKVPAISFRPVRVSHIAGININESTSRAALIKLRCQVKGGDPWQVVPPSDRLDITGEHDLVEEVIRLFGLEHITSTKPKSDSAIPLPAYVVRREKVRDVLSQAGFIEMYNYSFDLDNIAEPLGYRDKNSLEIINPVAPEQKYLRQSLLPRLLQNLVTNKAEIRRKQSSYPKSLFEISHVFKKGKGGQVIGVKEAEHVAGISLEKTADEIEQLLTQALGKKLKFIHLGPLDPEKQRQLPYSLLRETPLVLFEVELAKRA